MSHAVRPPSITVAVIDDHDAIHAGIQVWCAEAGPPVHVAAVYYSVADYLAAQSDPVSRKVDVTVLDLELQSRRPDLTAIEMLTAAGHQVVVYSHLTNEEIILSALDLGAASYISKSEGKNHLLEAIQAAAADKAYVGPRMASAMHGDERGGRPQLSEREREVLVAWFHSESKEFVGRQLFIAPSSVNTHLQRIRAKYAAIGRPARTKAALVARAVQDGIISVEEL